MSNEYQAEVLFRPETDELRFLPEGPHDCGEGRFSWVAIQHGGEAQFGSLNVYDIPAGENRSYVLDGRPGFAIPTGEPDEFIVGLEREVRRINVQTGQAETICEGVDSNVENTIINDGEAFSEGIVFGTKHLEFSDKRAGLYFLRAADRQLIQLRDDQICSNGKVIQSEGDQTFLIDIDTPTKTIVRYAFDTQLGRLGQPEIVVDLRDGEVFPDGMIATPDGESIIVAFYNPQDAERGETRQFSLADGAVEAIWFTPGSPQVTCPQLVEVAGRVELILTTAVEHMSEARQQLHPQAGAIFHAETSFETARATPVLRFP